MVTAIVSLQTAGGQVPITTGVLSVDVTLPNPVSDYVLIGQTGNRGNCWLSGASGNVATFGLNQPADADTFLTFIALPLGTTGLTSTVLPAGTRSYSVTVQTGQSVVPIPQWNTQYWYELNGNTYTFHFNDPPGGTASFSWLVVGPGQNTVVQVVPVTPAAYSLTTAAAVSTNYLPVVIPTWNTATGVDATTGTITVGFNNASPSFAFTNLLVISLPINVSIFPLAAPLPANIQQPWVVNIIEPADFALRFNAMYPYPWLQDSARTSAGIAYALFISFGDSLNYVSQQLFYAWQACRLQTASNGALDLFAEDYFGNNLLRRTDESDMSYRARINAQLLQPKVSRQAIVNAIQLAFPGTIVRPIEPWNPGDTGGFGVSYYDYDSPEIPSLYGDPAQRYIGYLEIQLAPAQELNFQLWGADFGAAYDAWTGYFMQPIQEIQTQVGQINLLLQQITAMGTQIWVKYISGIVNPFSVGGSYNIATGVTNFNIQTPSVVGFYNLFIQLSQPIKIWQTGTNITGFNVTTSAPPGSGCKVNYVAVENSTRGTSQVVMDGTQNTLTIHGDAVNNILLIQPLWNTNFWYTSRSVNGINYEFETSPGRGQFVNSLLVPVAANAGYASISANATSVTLSLTVDARDIALVMPNWNTTIGVEPDYIHDTITLTFSNPAPGDGTGEVMYVSYPV